MNRRLFLAALAGAVLDPERLLWVPGKKLVSIPPPPKPTVEFVLASGALSNHLTFRVVAHYGGDANAAKVLEHLLNHRWATDAAWRTWAADEMERGWWLRESCHLPCQARQRLLDSVRYEPLRLLGKEGVQGEGRQGFPSPWAAAKNHA